jgi:CheY-like chemotaxis protein
VGNVLTNKPQGTGLGLAISSSIMVQLGGAIWVESEPDQGTVMAFSIPVYDSAVLPVPAVEIEVPEETSSSDELVQALEQHSVGKRVLVVDDDPEMVSEIADLLEPLGYRTVGCHSGHQAVDRARDLAPDSIILDTLRLEISGYDVLRMLKSDSETSKIPVVVLADEDQHSKAVELGAAAVVSKSLMGALARTTS